MRNLSRNWFTIISVDDSSLSLIYCACITNDFIIAILIMSLFMTVAYNTVLGHKFYKH